MIEYRPGRSIAQIIPFYRHIQKKQRVNHKQTSHNNGSNSDSKDCCLHSLANIGNAMDNKIPLAPVDCK